MTRDELFELIDDTANWGTTLEKTNRAEAIRLEVDNLYARVAELEKANRWIAVSERLPEVDGERQVFYIVDGIVYAGYFQEYENCCNPNLTVRSFEDTEGYRSDIATVTYWKYAELPEPPEE